MYLTQRQECFAIILLTPRPVLLKDLASLGMVSAFPGYSVLPTLKMSQNKGRYCIKNVYLNDTPLIQLAPGNL